VPLPWLLAGGLRPDNLAEAVKLTGATMVDVSSGVESSRGVKSIELIRAFLARTADDPAFVAGDVDTGFIERHGERLIPSTEPGGAVLQAAANALLPADATDPWTALTGFRTNAPAEHRVEVEVADTAHVVAITGTPAARVARVAEENVLFLAGEAWPFGKPRVDHASGGHGVGDGAILSPMPGRIVSVDVSEGAKVAKGQKLLVLEAMKMEQALTAPFNGVVSALTAVAGAQVAEGITLARIEKEEG